MQLYFDTQLVKIESSYFIDSRTAISAEIRSSILAVFIFTVLTRKSCCQELRYFSAQTDGHVWLSYGPVQSGELEPTL